MTGGGELQQDSCSCTRRSPSHLETHTVKASLLHQFHGLTLRTRVCESSTEQHFEALT